MVTIRSTRQLITFLVCRTRTSRRRDGHFSRTTCRQSCVFIDNECQDDDSDNISQCLQFLALHNYWTVQKTWWFSSHRTKWSTSTSGIVLFSSLVITRGTQLTEGQWLGFSHLKRPRNLTYNATMHANITHTGDQLPVASLKFVDWNPWKLTVRFLSGIEQEAQLPQRNSASAADIEGGGG